MTDVSSQDLLAEFDLVSEELLELLDAGLPKGRSARDDQCPEGWDSKQIVAHIVELIEFWRQNIDEGLKRRNSAVMGRSNFDSERINRIDSLSKLPTGELIERLTIEIGKAAGLLASLENRSLSVEIMHLTDGQITLSELCSRHLITHISEHLAQLGELEQAL